MEQETANPAAPQRRRNRTKAAGEPPRTDNALSPEVLAAIAAATKAAVAQVFEQPGGPRRVVPPPRTGAVNTAPNAADEDENYDPLAPAVQRTARAKVMGEDAGVPRAKGLSDDEVLSMFQEEELGEYDVPKEIIPDGMVYGWKLKEALGKGNSGYEAELRRRGWENVSYEDHPGVFGLRDESGPVIRKGLQLMRRPAEMEELRQRYWRLVAKQAVRDKVAQMAAAPPGTGPRTHKDVAPRVSRTYEALPVE